jgi:hypothetical protein
VVTLSDGYVVFLLHATLSFVDAVPVLAEDFSSSIADGGTSLVTDAHCFIVTKSL